MKRKNLEQTVLRELLDYDPETGVFTWRARPGAANGFNARFEGKQAGTLENGYIQISLMNKLYKAHRLAFLWMTGRMPDVIDHKNCNRSDNRWLNLREATYSLNFANGRRRRNNTSGLKGVHWFPQTGQWRAKIQKDGRVFHLGLFETKEAAAVAYAAAADKIFGEFARTE